MRFFKENYIPVPRHKWFAWLPVYAYDEERKEFGYAWLEYVWREGWPRPDTLTKWRYTIIK